MTDSKARLLIIDDSANICSSLGKILEISGYNVDTSLNASDALQKLTMANYNLVISDIEMPGLSGLDFLQRVRFEYGLNIPVILMTGYLDHDYFIRAIRLGASDFVRKPIDAKNIIRSIQSILDKSREHNEYTEFYQYMESTELRFVIVPEHYNKVSFNKVLSNYLQTNFQINATSLNELLICIDEMIYNAFIHGTIGLTQKERLLDTTSFQALVKEKLQIKEIASKRIVLHMTINQNNQQISVSVEDNGEGFDYQMWLKKIKVDTSINLDGYGRGIALIYHLANNLEFSKEGRKITISKDIKNAKNEAKGIA